MSLGPLMIHETLVDDELAGTPSITKGIWRVTALLCACVHITPPITHDGDGKFRLGAQ